MAPLILPEALALRGLGQGTQLLRPPRALPPPNGHLHFMPNQIPQAPKEDRMLWALLLFLEGVLDSKFSIPS